jgi:hypothetical protein
MKKRKLLPRVVLGALLLALPAAADAPTMPPQYAQFDADSATIKDNFTRLEWDRRAIVQNVTYAVGESGCSFLATLQSTGRLPSIKELLTILDEEPHTEYEFSALVAKMIDAPAFADTPVDLPYWSSTPAPGVDRYWTLSFKTGLMEARLKTDKAHARCVR